MEKPPAQNLDTLHQLFREFGGPPGLRPPLRHLGRTNIPVGSVRNLLTLVAIGKHLRSSILIYYRHEALFRRAVMQAFAASGLPTLAWTDCNRLDHNREGVDVAAAFAVNAPALFVFDNFQVVPSELDRPLTFLHWNDGEMLPQLAQGSLLLLGVRFASLRALPVFGPSVMSRCSTLYLGSYDRSRAEKEYDQRFDQWQRAQQLGKFRPGGKGAAAGDRGASP